MEAAIRTRIRLLQDVWQHSEVYLSFMSSSIYENNPTLGAAKRIKMPQKDIIRLNDEEVNTFLNVVSNTNIKGNKLQIEKCKKHS